MAEYGGRSKILTLEEWVALLKVNALQALILDCAADQITATCDCHESQHEVVTDTASLAHEQTLNTYISDDDKRWPGGKFQMGVVEMNKSR